MRFTAGQRGVAWRFLGNFLVTAGVALLFFSGALTVYADPWGLRAPDVTVGSPAALLALEVSEQRPEAPPASETTSPAPSSGPPAAAAPPSQPPAAVFIPAIQVAAPVTEVKSGIVERDGLTLRRWETAAYAAGYHRGSAVPGAPGNTVISGHNNALGAVFRRLDQLRPGDAILVTAADGRAYPYRVTDSVIVQEEGVPLEVRRRNAGYMAPTEDHRLTLISCWPYWTNTHRVIVTAQLIRLSRPQAASALPVSTTAAPPAAAGRSGGPPRDEELALRQAERGPAREETLPAQARQWSTEVRPPLTAWERLDRGLTRGILPLAYALTAFTGTLAATWRVVVGGGPALWLGLLSGLAALATLSLELTYRSDRGA